jgi:UDP-N-acetylmuramate--alanine ligase
LPELAPALKNADHVIISKIFPSRETDPGDFTGANIAESVPNSLYIPEFEQIIEHLKSKTKKGDVVLVMGSGNSDKLAREILQKLFV